MKTHLSSHLTALLATVVTLGTVANPASAAHVSNPALNSTYATNLVPQTEGEIDVGLGCYDGCIGLHPLISKIESLVDSTTGYTSRLFVDSFSTKSLYNSSGTNKIVFEKQDKGTTPTGFWFRPSEYDGTSSEENGQLEVGTYRFTFAQTLPELIITFFDTESKNSTGILAVNGNPVTEWVAKGANANIAYHAFRDVNSVVLKLGQDTPSGTGDGVNFRLTAVPEPLTLLGSAAALGLGAAMRRRNQEA